MLFLIVYFTFLIPILFIWGQIPYWLLKKTGSSNPMDDLLMGMVTLSLVSMGLVLGGPINGITQLIFLFITLSLGWLWREQVIQRIKITLSSFSGMGRKRIMLRLALAIPIIYQGAQATKINDYGAYYLQTIQWMEKFGVVKGLANLYPPLGLFGNWHSLSALFDLAQIGFGNTHYINSLLLLVWIFWTLREWELAVFNFRLKLALLLSTSWILIFGFFFLTAPSADLAILVFSAWLFFRNFFEENRLHGFLSLFVATAIFWIKPPATAALLIGGFSLFRKDWGLKSKSYGLMALFPFMVLGFTKNTILSGYPLYPMSSPDFFDVEWKVPKDWNAIYRQGIASWGQNDNASIQKFEKPNENNLVKLKTWLSRPGYKGFMNKFLFGIVFTIPILLIIAFRKNKVPVKDLALTFLLLLGWTFDWYFLRQYRLLLGSSLVLMLTGSLLVFPGSIPKNLGTMLQKYSTGYFWGLTLVLGVLAWVPFSAFKAESRNKNITQSSGFTTRYLLIPWQQFDHGETAKWEIGGMVFWYYPERGYCWDAPIPCVSRSHHRILLEAIRMEVCPIGKTPQEGFKLVKFKN